MNWQIVGLITAFGTGFFGADLYTHTVIAKGNTALSVAVFTCFALMWIISILVRASQ